MAWNTRLPVLQSASAATQAGDVLLKYLPDASDYSFIDICAGGGGPTPTIEKRVNDDLRDRGQPSARFWLTDLHPHLQEWARLSKRSEYISFVPESVDAAQARGLADEGKKECRLFSLAFHHLDDDVAGPVLKSAVDTADAFVIFELQDRSFLSLVNVLGVGIGSALVSLFFFWHSPLHLLFTYLIPIVPFVITFDGFVSSLRTRTPDEILGLLRRQPGIDSSDWTFLHGKKMILPPVGYLHWFVGIKR